MIAVLLSLLLGIALVALVRVADRRNGLTMLGIIVGGYALRLLLQNFVREVAFFSHTAGGDCIGYERIGMDMARIWRLDGISFLTEKEWPELGPTVLPQNLYAAVIYLNSGDATRLGCTALVAFAAALTCFNLYHLAVELGADVATARWMMTLFYLSPAYLHYTSDMFKDGLVACFTVGALASGVRLMHRISVLHMAIGILCLWGLWYVRFYLIFLTTAPLLVGLLGMRSKSLARPILGAIGLAALGVYVFVSTDLGESISTRAWQTYEAGTSEGAIASNASTGSGVVFDDGGSRYGALWLKILYVLFSPFPWASGSFGFHIGKIDVFLICFFAARAWAASRIKERRQIFMMIMTFVVPCTIAYATSMANVGLIVRQRLVIVVAVAFLAAFYKPTPRKVKVSAAMPSKPLRLAAD
jgi:hypothetical protein